MRKLTVLLAIVFAFITVDCSDAAFRLRRKPIELPPLNVTAPTISGDVSVDGELSLSTGVWKNEPSDYLITWRRGTSSLCINSDYSDIAADEDISDNFTYSIVLEDIGYKLCAKMEGTNASGSDTVYTSVTATVAGVVPNVTANPTITLGSNNPPEVGDTLTATLATCTGTPVPSHSLQWKDDGVSISGATGISVTLATAQVGGAITVTDTCENSAGTDSGTSTATSAVVVGDDVTAPVLSNMTGIGLASANTKAAVSVDSTENSGTLYTIIQPSAVATPSGAQIKAGQDGSGAAATWSKTLIVEAIDTYDVDANAPTGLTNGQTYEACAIQTDLANFDSNVICSAVFTAGNVDVTGPTLSNFTAVAGADDRWAELSIQTGEGGGTIYCVIDASADSAPTAAQIRDGKGADGITAVGTGSVIVSAAGTYTKRITTLVAATSYKGHCTHYDSSGNASSVASSSAFKTDTLIASYATSGVATSIGSSTGSEIPLTGNQADYLGTNNSLGWTDTGDSVTGVAQVLTSALTFNNGVNSISVKFKNSTKHASAMWVRIGPTSTTVTSTAYFDITNGTVGTESWTGTPTITSLGDGWWQINGSIDMTGADVAGFLQLRMGNADGSTNVLRNGTNTNLFHDLRVTRATP